MNLFQQNSKAARPGKLPWLPVRLLHKACENQHSDIISSCCCFAFTPDHTTVPFRNDPPSQFGVLSGDGGSDERRELASGQTRVSGLSSRNAGMVVCKMLGIIVCRIKYRTVVRDIVISLFIYSP